MLEVVMSNNVVDDHNDVNDNLSQQDRELSVGRPYHHGNLRTALLAEAERTIRERGVHDVSLRQLAREVGVSHGAPRRHFPDRQERTSPSACGRSRRPTSASPRTMRHCSS
jgi:hypothetical protein